MDIEDISLNDKKIAEQYIQSEVEEMKNLVEFNYDNFNSLKEDVNSSIFYIPDVQKYCHVDDIETQQKFDSYNELYDIRKNLILKEDGISRKLEEKSNILLGGHYKRQEVLNKKYSELSKEINDYRQKLKIYQELKNQEDFSILKRQKDLEDKIETLKQKEYHLQKRYKNLTEIFNDLEKA